MGRPITDIFLQRGKRKVRASVIADTGSLDTVLPSVFADALGVECEHGEEETTTLGATLRVCRRNATAWIPGTRCMVERLPVAFVAKDSPTDAPPLLGADFMERAGMVPDLSRRPRMPPSVSCRPQGRDPNPPAAERLRPLRRPRSR